MKPMLPLALFLSLAAPAAADDAPKLKTLSSKEVADGWILLFDGATTFGWRSPNDSKWTVAEGMLAPQAEKPGLLVTTSPFRDYVLKFDYVIRGDSKVEVGVGCDADGKPDVNVSPPIQLFPGGRSWTTGEITVKGGYVQSQQFGSFGAGFTRSATVGVGGPGVPTEKSGYIALSGNGAVFRNIKLLPLNPKTLFNGTDLKGWKEYPGKKSKFGVTKEGWLNLKDGPGDLQTEGEWADFVLQLECISNGEHGNSGVFFRCQPGEFQQGYEAQINNVFTAEPAKEYAIEVYDPKTNELKDTQKEKYTAVDYGTGGIYRRIPARQELSKDKEWFGMTVVASGRHIGVWVNGVQAVDWTDNRKLKDNARNGCRLEKGPISLQGHEVKDGEEDLSFRNIRVIDLSPKEAKKEP